MSPCGKEDAFLGSETVPALVRGPPKGVAEHTAEVWPERARLEHLLTSGVARCSRFDWSLL